MELDFNRLIRSSIFPGHPADAVSIRLFNGVEFFFKFS